MLKSHITTKKHCLGSSSYPPRQPNHSGEIQLEEFLEQIGMTQSALAEAFHIPFWRVNSPIEGKRNMTPSTDLSLAKYFGTNPRLWMNFQLH
ncbi:MAG: HigA family addiction module antitoxin [Cyanobacteria bacterium J06642_2]